MTGAITAKESEHEHCTMDHSGTARRALSVRRWHEAGHAASGDDEADADCAAGLVRAFYRNRRGARRDRTDPPLALGDAVGSHTASRRWSGDRNDRCDSVHVDGWSGRVGADAAGGGATLCIRRLWPRAANTAARLDQSRSDRSMAMIAPPVNHASYQGTHLLCAT